MREYIRMFYRSSPDVSHGVKKILEKLRSRGRILFEGAFVPLAQTPAGSKLGQLYNSSGDFSTFVNGAFKFALALGAIVAVLRIAWAGYLYMGQADMWSSKGKAKQILGDVTLGLVLLLAIWLILNQINPDILKLNALRNIRPVPQSSQQN